MKPSEVIPNPFLRFLFYFGTLGFGIIALRDYEGIQGNIGFKKKDDDWYKCDSEDE